MKNILALGICLVAFNTYAQDTEETMAQDISTMAVDMQTREVAIEEASTEIAEDVAIFTPEEIIEATSEETETELSNELTTEQTVEIAEGQAKETSDEFATEMSEDSAVEQETFTVTMQNADGLEVNVQARVITLAQTKELFNSPEGVEFFATKGITSTEAFDSIVAFLAQIQNKTIEIEGNTVPLDGISLVINEKNYFIKTSEFANIDNDSVENNTTLEAQEESDLNN